MPASSKDQISPAQHYPLGAPLIAFAIIAAWLAALSFALFFLKLPETSSITILATILILTQLYTGLFITAHDAMHGLAAPGNHRLNSFIGILCVTLYALFSYSALLEKHKLHHSHPTSPLDPDFVPTRSPLRWYLGFLMNYLTWKQILMMSLIHLFLTKILFVGLAESICFWALPTCLSTVQLFYFGTYLPHVESPSKFVDKHCARSLGYNFWSSLVTCYHFGACHLQHHRYPWIPWWKLYSVKSRENADQLDSELRSR
jgi:beta-carotene ketolase (CrtW type)